MGNPSNHALAAATAQVRACMHEFDANKHGTFAAGRRYAPHAKAVLSQADAPASPRRGFTSLITWGAFTEKSLLRLPTRGASWIQGLNL